MKILHPYCPFYRKVLKSYPDWIISFTFNNMKKWILIVSIAILYLSASAQCTSNRYTAPVFPSVTTTSGIQFGTATAYAALFPQNLYLDFYEPTGDTIAQRPLIVYVFGGGFLIGTRIDPPIPAYCTYLAKCGYTVASIDYRIGFNPLDSQSAERAVYRGVQDLRGAVRFLCQHYPQYRIDTQAIFLTGSSAGCIAGFHSTLAEPSDWPQCVHGSTLEPSDLGCLDCDDNTDNNGRMPFIRGIVNHWGAIFDTSFIRTTHKDNVPTISVHGDQDPIVPYNYGPPFSLPIFPNVYGSLPIHKRMDDIGIKNELVTLAGYGHEPWLLAPQLIDTCYVHEIPFLYSILKPKPIAITGDSTVCLDYQGSYAVRYDAGSRYCWDVTGGTILHTNNNTITVQWTSAGNHLITVQELTRNKVNGDRDSFIVHVIAHPVAAFGDSVLHTQAVFSDSSTGAISWAYSFGDNSSTAHMADPTHSYRSQGTFTVQLIVSNGHCADTTSRIVLTDTCPSGLSISYTVQGDTVSFSTNSSGSGYSWHFGDGDTAGGSAPSHIYQRSQSYLVSLWTTTAKACRVYGSVILPFTAVETGINGLSAETINVFPNPVDDILHISPLSTTAEIGLYDMRGKKISGQFVEPGAIISLDMSSLSKGIYILKIIAPTLTVTTKVSKR
jgi:PKD repeat protein/pimeloyl-ACP methyl ester carboxylesterase